ncbi:MAG: glycosyltransferase family 1 protein [Candidatus Moranbacteria bacterium]|nr:glycosyltransferase family 1 protein [Candidatus Moranbacteria bacterium]
MKIGINASFLRKLDTGIGQVSRGFVKEIIRSHSDENEYFLYLEKDIELKLPKNFHKRIFLPAWKRDDLIRKIWWEKFLLPKKVREDKCDVFISLYQCPTFFPKNIQHKMLVHDLIPKIFPDYLDNWRKKFYFFLTQKAIQHADGIITVSEWSKKDIHKYLKISRDKIRTAYPSVGKEFFEPSTSGDDNKILEKYGVFGRYIFYISGFDFRKNIPGLLDAYDKLMKNYEINDITLVLGGEDKSQFSKLFTNIKAEIKKLDIEEKVRIIGFVRQEDLPALYRNCELYILPSFYEGFGLMPLEAMASGAPTAVSKTSSLPEVGGDAVLYFNPHDTDEMARVMGKVLRNNKLRLRLAEKGKDRAKKFNWESFVKAFFEK